MQQFRTRIGTALVLLFFAATGACKCANRLIYIDARIVGPANAALTIKAAVTPDPNWEPQPTIVIKDNEVSGEIYFNTTKSEGKTRDNCSRVPKTVDIALFEGDREIDHIQLRISKDFIRTEMRDYKPRRVMTLRIR